MGFFSDIVGGFLGSGKKDAQTSGANTQAIETRLSKRFDELREKNKTDFEESLGRVQALQNPFLAKLAGLEQDVRSTPAAQIGQTASTVNAVTRGAGGSRSGQTFGLARAALSTRVGAQTGLQAGLQRLQALQGVAGIQQAGAGLQEADLTAQRNFIGQGRNVDAGLIQALLQGQAGIGGAGVAAQGNILAQSQGTGFGANISRGIGNAIANAPKAISGGV